MRALRTAALRTAAVVIAFGLSGVGLAAPAPAAATGNHGGPIGPCVTTVHTEIGDVEPTAPAPLPPAPDKTSRAELTATGVKLATKTFDGQGFVWRRTLPKPVALAYVSGAHYTVTKHAHATVPEAMPAMLLFIKSPSGERATLVYEPYGNDGTDAAPPLARKTWHTSKGVWWTSDGPWPAGDFPVEGGKRAPNPHKGLTLAQVAQANRGAVVTGFGWRQNWAEGLVATVHDIGLAGKTWTGKKVCEFHKWAKPRITFTDTCTTTKIVVEHTGWPRGEWLVAIGSGNFIEEHKLAEAGERATAEHASAVGEITVTITVRGKKIDKATHTWKRPKDCPSATPSPTVTPTVPVPGGGGGGQQEGLPVTGPAVPALIAVALAALAVGGGLLLAARRRRVRLTT
jgi:hypothetical protein